LFFEGSTIVHSHCYIAGGIIREYVCHMIVSCTTSDLF
jgi:hypothetical protein